MQHFFLLQDHLPVWFDIRILITRLGIQIENLSPVIPADGHLVWTQRIKSLHPSQAVPDDLGVGIAPDE